MPYILGTRQGISVFNLELTLAHLRRAYKVTREVAYNGGIILFLGTRDLITDAVREAALSCDAHYVINRWIAGTLANTNRVLGLRQQQPFGLSSEDA